MAIAAGRVGEPRARALFARNDLDRRPAQQRHSSPRLSSGCSLTSVRLSMAARATATRRRGRRCCSCSRSAPTSPRSRTSPRCSQRPAGKAGRSCGSFRTSAKCVASGPREAEVVAAAGEPWQAATGSGKTVFGSVNAKRLADLVLQVGQNFRAWGWSKGFNDHAVVLLTLWWLFGPRYMVCWWRAAGRRGGA